MQGVAVLGVVWWSWNSYVWLTNQADADRPAMRAAMMTATALMAVVALAVPQTFGDDSPRLAALGGGLLVLTLLAAALGHLLSGRAMCPALREVEQQEQFLRETAHELRTPLTTLRLLAESGQRRPEAAQESLLVIEERVQKATTLGANLLARIATRPAPHSPP